LAHQEQVAGINDSGWQTIWDSFSPGFQAFVEYVGFYKKPDSVSTWVYFLPYTFMFFYAIAARKIFEHKLEQESMDLLDEVQSPVNALPPNLHTLDETGRKEVLKGYEDQFYRQAQKYYAMKFRVSYVLWRMKPLWPVLNFVAENWHYVLVTFIVGVSIYYSIALVWLLYMLIFVLYTWSQQKRHTKYQKQQVNRFLSEPSVWDVDFDDGEEKRHSRMTSSANQARVKKLEEKYKSEWDEWDDKRKNNLSN
jgi:ABC-type multidrug transport system fused ATPase/permease subunit